MQVRAVEIDAIPVVATAHQGAYTRIGETFEKLGEALKEQGLPGGSLIAIYYDDPHSTPEENLRSYACAVVHGNTDVSASGLIRMEIPGGRYATATATGPYSNLPKAWEDFFIEGIGKSGLKTKPDLCFEKYLNTMGEVAPDALVTELYAPIEG
ncbi:MAG: AraC family transcriptional regulator [Fimbriimonadaceae bacterium]|jgi:AraC family transcriptional regulator|nr:AraC family transcriptional regulator [Fimbriimonadaceae bacterium]